MNFFYIVGFLLFSSLIHAKNFSNETSLSVVTTGGNSNAETYSTSTDTKYKPEKREYRLYGTYILSYADDPEVEGTNLEETARNWNVGTSVTQDLMKKLGATFGLGYEGNEFAGFSQRQNTDLGLKYIFSNTDDLKLNLELGYRNTVEKRTVRDEDGEDIFNFQKGNVSFLIEQKLTESTSYKFWLQYLPNFTEPEDYQVNFEPSLTVKMSNILSLRVSYKGQYDNELNPGVEEYLDHTTSTSLVAKF